MTNEEFLAAAHEMAGHLEKFRDAIIDGCALAAHRAILDSGGTFDIAHDAMAAIRALKDKP